MEKKKLINFFFNLMLVWSSLVVWGPKLIFKNYIKHVKYVHLKGGGGGGKWPIPSFQRLLGCDSVMVVIDKERRIEFMPKWGGNKHKLFRKCWYAIIYGQPNIWKKLVSNIYSCHHSRPLPWKKGATDGRACVCVCVCNVRMGWDCLLLVDGWMNGWMDEWMNGWMDGWMDGWIHWLRFLKYHNWMNIWYSKFTIINEILNNS
jgi:hypothetical protein